MNIGGGGGKLKYKKFSNIVDFIVNNKNVINLQNKDNKKFILPDEKLKFLLGINQEQELTYFNLQKYMNKHFISEPLATV
jgi:chromatin remodeling complex protein RSC6